MTEKQKMLSGEFYKMVDELDDERDAAQDLLFKYNKLRISQYKKRRKVLSKILGGLGDETYIEPPFWCGFGKNIFIGDHCYANVNLTILDFAKVTIGDYVMFGPNVNLYAATHPISPKLRHEFIGYTKPITVCNNVWIGGNVCVLPGVTIGENSVIGAGSVVTHDIPPNVVAVGNPCKIIKKIEE
ncbi:MAG: sugar O-acetyltransferase [Clostridiales bacterium]|jgi:acetyltransferase-like isoleucine patch superfamily enzyme|nr:sugar O-acetyltransferase [Clostridiales bacterium]